MNAGAQQFGAALLAVGFLMAMVVLNTLVTSVGETDKVVVGFDQQHIRSPETAESKAGALSSLQGAHMALQSRYDQLSAEHSNAQARLAEAEAALTRFGATLSRPSGASVDTSAVTGVVGNVPPATAARPPGDTPLPPTHRAAAGGAVHGVDAAKLTALELPGFCLKRSLPELAGSGVKVADKAECFQACAAKPDCVAWTLFDGRCTLRRAFLSPCKQFESWLKCLVERRPPNEAGCISGVVRPAPQRATTPADAALLQRLNQGGGGGGAAAGGVVGGDEGAGASEQVAMARASPGSGLAEVDLTIFGQCHNHSCLDVDHCAARYTGPPGKFGFVLTHDLRRPPGKRFARSITYTQLQAKAREVPADVIIMVPNDTLAQFPLTADERAQFASEGVKIHEVSWILPPRMRWTKKVNWCGFQDFIRLNAFGIPGYDALISYDSDIFVRANMGPIFRCAAQNRILITAGPASPCNIGFVAFRPDPRLVAAAVYFAQGANFSLKTGWDNAGWGPGGNKFTGGECGQGFYWTHFFFNGGERGTALAEDSYRVAGIERPKGFQVDRCRYNFQRWGWWKSPWGWLGDENAEHCDFPGFDCKRSVLAIHKAFDTRSHRLIPLPSRPEKVPDNATLVNKTYGNPQRTDYALNVSRDFASLAAWRCTEGWMPKL